MAALSDESVGISNEGTPGTYTAINRWYEWVDGSIDWKKNPQQGKGLRVGSPLERSGRRVITSGGAEGDINIECTTKGMGLLWESALGVGTVTNVSGATYQHNFTLATGTTLPSRSMQTGTVADDGTVYPVTYTGGMVKTWDFELANDGLATLKTGWDFRDYTTVTAYVTPSYVSAPSLFHFGQATVTIGGVVTAPTTTAIATGGTAATNVRSFKLTGDNGAQDKRFNMIGTGRKSRQLAGQRKVTGEMEIELTSAVIRDAYLADTALPVTLTMTSTEALSSGFATLQIVLPEVRLNGEVPQPSGADLTTLKCSFDVLDNLVATQAIWVVSRTSDSAV